MIDRWSTLPGGLRLGLRLGVLALTIAALGLPINSLIKYGLLLAVTAAVFIGKLQLRATPWAGAVALAAFVAVVNALWPAPRIDEGFNVFLPGPNVEETSGLPPDVAQALTAQFNAQYPPEKGCDDRARSCWRPTRSPLADGYSFSSDAMHDHAAFSRRVMDISFSNLMELRLGTINDWAYAWPDDASDVKRFDRDRHSLNLFDRFHITFPLFLVYRFPAEFIGSALCWHGTVLWEGDGEHFSALTNTSEACRTLHAEDSGRRIFATAILPEPQLTITLHAPLLVQLRRVMEIGLMLIGVIGIAVLLIRIEPRRLIVPGILIGVSLLTVVFVDTQFIAGYRPLDGGDDGITYEGYARAMARHLVAGNWVGVLRGEEPIYYFTPGMRYFRLLEHWIFGETFLGYLSMMLMLPFLVLAFCRRFVPTRWALAFVLLFVATPLGVLFGSTLSDYVVWAARGFSDPFAFVLLIAGCLLIIPASEKIQELDPTKAFLGALLLAMATFCRPNLLLASTVMVVGGSAFALASRRTGWAVALCAGFATLAVSPLHNVVFGHSFVPFSDNVSQPQTLLMTPIDYVNAARELVTLNFSGDYFVRALEQMQRWLGGPHKILATIPLNAVGIAILLSVGIFGAGYNPWLRIVAFATLLQHGIGICYVNYTRYNLGTWLLTAIVVLVWAKTEGRVLQRLMPGLTGRMGRSTPYQWLAARLSALEQTSHQPEPVQAAAHPSAQRNTRRKPLMTSVAKRQRA